MHTLIPLLDCVEFYHWRLFIFIKFSHKKLLRKFHFLKKSRNNIILSKIIMITIQSSSGYVASFKDESSLRLYLNEAINMLHGGYYLEVEDDDPIFEHLLLDRDGPEFRNKEYHKRWFGGVFDTTDLLCLAFNFNGNPETDEISFTFDIEPTEIFIVLHTTITEFDGKRIKLFDQKLV